MIQVQDHTYTDGETNFIGKLAWDDESSSPAPGVLVVPAFAGLGPFEEKKAREFASRGCVALAVDYYGEGRRAANGAEASVLMEGLNSDRALLTRRMRAALSAMKSLDLVSADRIGAMGFCFGGKCVLDLARSGAAFAAAVSIHGVYDPPEQRIARIEPAILILHGWDDPLAQPDDLLKLAKELTESCADWQVLAFGHTGHAFTNPNAQQPEQGMLFNAVAAARSWSAIDRFFDEQLHRQPCPEI